MTLSTTDSFIDPSKPATWGVAAHGATLLVDSGALPDGPVLTIDVENNPDGSCAGIGATADGKEIHYFTPRACTMWGKDIFAGRSLVGHNAKYDIQMLHSWGFNVSPDQIVWDTQIAEYVKDSTLHKYGLKHLAKTRYGVNYPDFKLLVGAGKKAVPIGTLPLAIVANYNGCDVLVTHRLYRDQIAGMSTAQIAYLESIEMPTMRVLLEMEERGVQINADYIRSLDARFTDGISGVAASIRRVAAAEINLNSHQQIRQLLLDKARLRLPSTAAEELRKHQTIPLVKDILRYRELNKLRSTYTSVLAERSNGKATYRLHARFNQTATQTGRLSSSEPNLQNIPTRTDEGDQIREGFIASANKVFIDADYSQIEPRLMAHFSQDPALMRVFTEGRDLYDSVTQAVGLPVTPENRKLSKILWLAMSYNAGAFKIGITAGISTYKASEFLKKMQLYYSQFFYWKDKLIAQAEIDGGITTLFGRFIPLGADLAHLGPNYTVQGSAAEVMKLAIQATRHLNPVMTVHDEMVLELHDASIMPAIKSSLESLVHLSVPLVVEMGHATNWSGAKP